MKPISSNQTIAKDWHKTSTDVTSHVNYASNLKMMHAERSITRQMLKMTRKSRIKGIKP